MSAYSSSAPPGEKRKAPGGEAPEALQNSRPDKHAQPIAGPILCQATPVLRTIPEHHTKPGYVYHLLERNAVSAIYEQRHATGGLAGYEVIRIRTRGERRIGQAVIAAGDRMVGRSPGPMPTSWRNRKCQPWAGSLLPKWCLIVCCHR
jgi:hypothetical protein